MVDVEVATKTGGATLHGVEVDRPQGPQIHQTGMERVQIPRDLPTREHQGLLTHPDVTNMESP